MSEHDPPPVDVQLQAAADDLSDAWFVQGFNALVETLGQGIGARASFGNLLAKLGGSGEDFDHDQLGVAYFLTRLNGSRKACVFAALSAEAYVNRLLYNRLDGRDVSTALGIRPITERFVVGTHLALGHTLFPRDDSLHRDLVELFRLRNKLVHAEPQEPQEDEVFGRRAYEICNPRIAHAHLVTAARTAQRVLPQLTPSPPAPTAMAEAWLSVLGILQPHTDAAADTLLPTMANVQAEIAAARNAHPNYFLDAATSEDPSA